MANGRKPCSQCQHYRLCRNRLLGPAGGQPPRGVTFTAVSFDATEAAFGRAFLEGCTG